MAQKNKKSGAEEDMTDCEYCKCKIYEDDDMVRTCDTCRYRKWSVHIEPCYSCNGLNAWVHEYCDNNRSVEDES